jgi:hypothetical protein
MHCRGPSESSCSSARARRCTPPSSRSETGGGAHRKRALSRPLATRACGQAHRVTVHRASRTRESLPSVDHLPACLVMLFLIHHREDRGHRERNVRRYVVPCQVRRPFSVLFSVLSASLWFLFRQMTPVCPFEHGERTVNGYRIGCDLAARSAGGKVSGGNGGRDPGNAGNGNRLVRGLLRLSAGGRRFGPCAERLECDHRNVGFSGPDPGGSSSKSTRENEGPDSCSSTR